MPIPKYLSELLGPFWLSQISRSGSGTAPTEETSLGDSFGSAKWIAAGEIVEFKLSDGDTGCSDFASDAAWEKAQVIDSNATGHAGLRFRCRPPS
ncbi:unnamed protein product [Heligmosomoides polygyrus]|uniref:CIA30 domain-containing protein n=1 Tax=Heligmosomoides polygyrus TaxID=6339 RepID=A0A183G852_HELPZ|nr:unnamed protein product [Heligmosomoides polygyrus]